MKSICLNIRALSFDGKTSLSSSDKLARDAKTNTVDLVGAGAAPLQRFGVLRLSDLVARKLIAATDHVYVSWVGHSGQAGVTSFGVSSSQPVAGRKASAGPEQTYNPNQGKAPLGPFGMRPTDALVLHSNGQGDQVVSLALLIGTAVEVEGLLNHR